MKARRNASENSAESDEWKKITIKEIQLIYNMYVCFFLVENAKTSEHTTEPHSAASRARPASAQCAYCPVHTNAYEKVKYVL